MYLSLLRQNGTGGTVEDFETSVHDSRTYFGFFNLTHTCESICRFYSYNVTTNYLKLKIGGLQVDETSVSSQEQFLSAPFV
jgi:hypothetical protein